jgi:hypothetical protein
MHTNHFSKDIRRPRPKAGIKSNDFNISQTITGNVCLTLAMAIWLDNNNGLACLPPTILVDSS